MKKLLLITACILSIGSLKIYADDDGCWYQGQFCICSNTQWQGHCGTGPDKPGLYCRCD